MARPASRRLEGGRSAALAAGGGTARGRGDRDRAFRARLLERRPDERRPRALPLPARGHRGSQERWDGRHRAPVQLHCSEHDYRLETIEWEHRGCSTLQARSRRTQRPGRSPFRGQRVWFWATGNHVPFLESDGVGSLKAPYDILEGSTPPHTRGRRPVRARRAPRLRRPGPQRRAAPWGLPAYALSRIAYAGLTPLRGALDRHDHVHLDLIVNGKKVTIPVGVGLAEPVDSGPCPTSGLGAQGDCATGHIFTAQVANSPLHTPSTSGIIHIEADRPGSFTLGQFFDEWGVRLCQRAGLGGYCSWRRQAAARLRQREAAPGQPAPDRAHQPPGDRGRLRQPGRLRLSPLELSRRLARGGLWRGRGAVLLPDVARRSSLLDHDRIRLRPTAGRDEPERRR